MPSWDANVYLAFADERTRPAADLVARIPAASPARIVDLGCGPGNSTAVLRQRWPGADLLGVDNSPDMIAAARRDYPTCQWLQADIATWAADAPVDVLFANAALHWVPRHDVLFPRLAGMLAPGGALAVQMPAQPPSAVHRRIHEIADRPRWRDHLANAREAVRVESPATYYDLLCRLSSRIDLWETEYQHVLGGPEDVVKWVEGTGLRPFLQALPGEDERSAFRAELLAAVEADYPRRADGRVLLPYRRLFVVAVR